MIEYNIQGGSCRDDSDLISFLNEMGKDRWELVSWDLSQSESYHRFCWKNAIFKRNKIE